MSGRAMGAARRGMSDTSWGYLFERLNDMQFLKLSEYDWTCFAELIRQLTALGVIERVEGQHGDTFILLEEVEAAMQSGRRPRTMNEIMQNVIEGKDGRW